MAAAGAIARVLFSHLAATFALVFSVTVGLGLGTAGSVQRNVTFTVLLVAPFLLTDAKLTAPVTRTGRLRSGFIVRHHVLVTAPPADVRVWARRALEIHHAHSVKATTNYITGWVGPFHLAGASFPFHAAAGQYQLVIFSDTSSDESLAEVTICARPRRTMFLRRDRAGRFCSQLVHDVEAMIGEQRLVLL